MGIIWNEPSYEPSKMNSGRLEFPSLNLISYSYKYNLRKVILYINLVISYFMKYIIKKL